jgi:hypothetical protein
MSKNSISALSAGAYTTTLYVMVDRVKGGGRAPSPGWPNFSIMIECTPERGNCHSVCTLSLKLSAITGGFQAIYLFLMNWPLKVFFLNKWNRSVLIDDRIG